jgi:hypothetical protein
MPIFVPQAGTIGGRAASNTPVATPQSGAIISDFGQKMADVGQKWKTEDNAVIVQNTTLDMTKDMALARQEVDQLADPAAVGPAWAKYEADFQQKYFSDPNMEPQVRTQLALNFKELTTKHAVDLSGNILRLRQSQQVAAYTTQSAQIAAMVPGSDPATFQALREAKMKGIDALAGKPGYDPAEIAKLKVAADQDLYGQRATDAIAKDPAAFLAENDAKDSPYAALGDKRGDYIATARARLAQNAKAAQREANRQNAQLMKANNDQLDGIISLSGKGISPASRSLLTDPNFAANADPARVAQAKAAVALVDAMPTVAQMSLPELDAAIAAQKAKPMTEGYQADTLELLQKRRADKAAALTRDAAAFAQSNGQGFAPLPLDPAHIADLGPALAARVTDAAHLSATEGVKAAPLTLDEQAQIKALAGPDADPRQRTQLAQAIGGTLGMAGASGITNDPTFAWSAGLVAHGGTPALVTEIFRGQSRIKADNIVMPPVADRLTAGFDQMGKVISDMGGEVLQKEIYAAADGLYAARIGDPKASFDGEIYKQALHEVLGGTGTFDGRDARGGVQTIAGYLTPLPMGVEAGSVESVLGNLTSSDAAAVEKVLGTISTQGGPPMLDGHPLPPDDLATMHIEAVGNDLYRFVADNGQTPEVAPGKPYEFRLVGDARHPGLLGGAP